MFKKLTSLLYGEQNQISTGLICKLYLNKDKSKSMNIQLNKNDTPKSLIDKFEVVIKGNANEIDPQTQEYKFVLKDTLNNFNEFILKDNILLFDYLEKEKYELYYLPFNKKKSYSISMSLKDKNSYHHSEVEENEGNNSLRVLLIKQGTAIKYSKKLKKYVDISIYLQRDMLEIVKKKSNKNSIIIPLSSITDIKEIYDNSYIKGGFSTMMISCSFSSPQTKRIYIAFKSDDFDTWLLAINNQIHQYSDTYSFIKLCKDINELNRKKTSSLIQICNKFNNIKGILSLNFAKNIFYEFYDNKEVKDLYELFLLYQNNISKKDYVSSIENLSKIINILENNEEIVNQFDQKNILDNLKLLVEKLKEKNDNNSQENKKNEANLGDQRLIYSALDNIVTKFFKPKFNDIMDSQEKIDFMSNIINCAFKNQKENEFYDINSSINEIIIAK
mgnify:CR=1 FL=1